MREGVIFLGGTFAGGVGWGHFSWELFSWGHFSGHQIKNVKEYKVFIQYRVIAIRENIDPSLWNYVSTVKNPADIITRFDLMSFNENIIWRNGPKILYESNLENNSLDKIYIYENGDSIEENYDLEIQKHSLQNSV